MLDTSKKKFHLIICTCGIIISILITYLYAHSSMENKRNEAMYISEVYGTRLESLLNSLFHKTDIFETIIIDHNGEISKKLLIIYRRQLLPKIPGFAQYNVFPAEPLSIVIP